MDADDPLGELQAMLAGRLRGLPAFAGLKIICEAEEDFQASLDKALAGTDRLFLIISTPDQEPPTEEHVSTSAAQTTINVELAYQTGPGAWRIPPGKATRIVGRALHGTDGPINKIFYRGYDSAKADGRYSRTIAFRTVANAF